MADLAPTLDPSGDIRLGDLALLRVGLASQVLLDFAPRSIWAVVTDPPFSPLEFRDRDLAAMREGPARGVWRHPPTLGGSQRRAVPRFTVLRPRDLELLAAETTAWATPLLPALRPGAHVLVAASPLTVHVIVGAFAALGYEHRGYVTRLVQTLRGGDRPKGAEDEFADLSTMPRGGHEPWALFRAPLDAGRTVADNLRTWGTGALRRPSRDVPFLDVVQSAPARGVERAASDHPALKPQSFLRTVVRAMIPIPRMDALLVDPFAGSASTLAAAAHHGIRSFGIERDPVYAAGAEASFRALAALGSG